VGAGGIDRGQQPHSGRPERRFLTLGLHDDQVVSVAQPEQDENILVISIRKATKHEARFDFSQITD
jgi:uncharacterized DUF497 family protein